MYYQKSLMHQLLNGRKLVGQAIICALKIRPLVAGVFAACCLVPIYAGAQNASTDTQIIANTVKSRPAKLIKLTPAENRKVLSLPAVIEARQVAEVAFQVGGQIVELDLVESNMVSVGQQIGALDNSIFTSDVEQARAEFENAESEYQRAVSLISEGAISQSVVDSRKAERDIALANLRTVQKNLNDTVLRAPFNGRISRLSVERFQTITAGQIIAELQSEEMQARVNIPATMIAFMPQLNPGTTTLTLDALPGVEILATFQEGAGRADSNSQTFEVAFSFDVPDNLLILPGMTATLSSSFTFKTGSLLNEVGISVPLAAIIAEGDDIFVWVIDETTGAVERRTIQVGQAIGEMLTITSGLNGNETIVGAGGSFIYEGMRVHQWSAE